MEITETSSGDFSNAMRIFNKLANADLKPVLEPAMQDGVANLAQRTPTDSGKTAQSWRADIVGTSYGVDVQFYNSNMDKGNVPVALLIMYGHGTGTGGYVPPRDFVTPALSRIYSDVSSAVDRMVEANGQ